MNDFCSLNSSDLLLHIGYHKTGTSYLQSQFFVPSNGFERWPNRQIELHPAIVDYGPFEEIPNSVKRILADQINQCQSAQRTWVLSHERLSGHPSSGGYDSKILADRLFKLFPKAKIFIGIREQVSMIRSAYSQFVTEGGSLSLRKYLRDPQAPLRKVPLFSLKHFEYAPLIEYYQQLFGPERVLVLPFELFNRQPVDFLNRLGHFALDSRFVDIKPEDYQSVWINRRHSVVTQTFRRFLNAIFTRNQFSNSGFIELPKIIRLYQRLAEPLERLIPASVDSWLVKRQSKRILEFVSDYYRTFNDQTSKLIGINLRDMGYSSELMKPMR